MEASGRGNGRKKLGQQSLQITSQDFRAHRGRVRCGAGRHEQAHIRGHVEQHRYETPALKDELGSSGWAEKTWEGVLMELLLGNRSIHGMVQNSSEA